MKVIFSNDHTNVIKYNMEVGASGVVIGGRDGVVVEMFGGQSASGEELSIHCGDPATLPVCGGSDRTSAQEKNNTILVVALGSP